MASVEAEVRRAYNRSTRDLNYHSRWVKARTAIAAAAAIGRYNSYPPSEIQDAVERIAHKDPKARFSVGRESSPVIYVETYKPQVALGVLGAMDSRPDELDKVSGERYIERLGKSRPGASLVRAWWD